MRRALVLLCLACGTTPPPPDGGTCGIDNCHDGCCREGTCRKGDEQLSCGRYGLACDDCTDGHRTCVDHVCSSSGGGAGGGGGSGGGGSSDAGVQFHVFMKYHYVSVEPGPTHACPPTLVPQDCAVDLVIDSHRYDAVAADTEVKAWCTVTSPTPSSRVVDCRGDGGLCGTTSEQCTDAGMSVFYQAWHCQQPPSTPANDCGWSPQ